MASNFKKIPVDNKEMRVKESIHTILNTSLFPFLKRTTRKFGPNALLKAPTMSHSAHKREPTYQRVCEYLETISPLGSHNGL